MQYIRLNEDVIDKLRQDVVEAITKELDPVALMKALDDSIKKVKMADGSFTFKKDFKFERKFKMKSDKRITLRITPDAFAKMALILATNDKEVAWHGISERVSDTEFVITDIMVYPQTVTSVTVDTDDEEYATWLIDIGEDAFNNLHTQMHSHVNMSVTPSGVDMGHRQKIVSQLGNDDYYIFMIWNKQMNWSAAVYDMPANIQYETEDIDVVVAFEDGTTAGDVLQDLKDKVVTAKSAPATYTPAKKNWWEEKTEKTKEVSGAGNGLDDFREYYANRGYYGGGYGGYGGYYD